MEANLTEDQAKSNLLDWLKVEMGREFMGLLQEHQQAVVGGANPKAHHPKSPKTKRQYSSLSMSLGVTKVQAENRVLKIIPTLSLKTQNPLPLRKRVCCQKEELVSTFRKCWI